MLPVGERTEEVNEVISLSETAGFIYIHDIGVRPHKEKINISKEFINKTKGAVAPYAARTSQWHCGVRPHEEEMIFF